MIDAATDIHKCARGDDIDGLKRNCSLFDNHISGLEKAEERRNDVCERLRCDLGGEAPSGRLLAIIERSEPQTREKLKALREALMGARGEAQSAQYVEYSAVQGDAERNRVFYGYDKTFDDPQDRVSVQGRYKTARRQCVDIQPSSLKGAEK